MWPSTCRVDPSAISANATPDPNLRPTVRITNPANTATGQRMNDNGSVAFAQYHLTQGKIVFTHTEVPKAHEGQGVGSALIRYALASARERGLKVVPVCPFFVDYFKKHAEEQDLLDDWYASRG